MSSSVKKSGAPCGPSTTPSSHREVSAGWLPSRDGSGGAPTRSSAARGAATSPVRSARPPWPPKPPRVNVAALPRYVGHVDAAAHEQVGAQPGAATGPSRSVAPARDRERLPPRHRLARRGVGAMCRAGEADDRVGVGTRRVGPVAVHSSPAASAGCRGLVAERGTTGRPSDRSAARRRARAERGRAGPARS